jgi:hypothetical protein
METPADRVVAEILRAEDLFLIEVGRLTLLFSRIEDCLVNDARQLAALSEDEKLKEEAASPALVQMRVLEKRDFLKRVYVDIARYYAVDHCRVDRILNELGNINKLRRTVVHGWIRWSEADKKPVMVDSRGQTIPAWPKDVLDLNMKVLAWYEAYYEEQLVVMASVMAAYRSFVERLSGHPKLHPALQELTKELKARLDAEEVPQVPRP